MQFEESEEILLVPSPSLKAFFEDLDFNGSKKGFVLFFACVCSIWNVFSIFR